MERYPPRKLELGAMIQVLLKEHTQMKEGLLGVRQAAAMKDFVSVGKIMKELDPLFRQHIADEESQILGLLVRTLGAKGAEKEILVFRQHRPIYALMVKITELANATSEELESRGAELESLFSEHAMAEETRVFPRATSLGGSGGAQPPSSNES